MSLRFVVGVLTILAVVLNVIDGCNNQSAKHKRPPQFARKAREVDDLIIVGESGFGLLLRPRNTKVTPKDYEAEQVFRRMDTNGNDMIDAAEWVDFSKETSVWDFVEILDYADVDDDEAVSLEEFLSFQIVKVDQSEEGKDDVVVTSSKRSVK